MRRTFRLSLTRRQIQQLLGMPIRGLSEPGERLALFQLRERFAALPRRQRESVLRRFGRRIRREIHRFGAALAGGAGKRAAIGLAALLLGAAQSPTAALAEALIVDKPDFVVEILGGGDFVLDCAEKGFVRTQSDGVAVMHTMPCSGVQSLQVVVATPDDTRVDLSAVDRSSYLMVGGIAIRGGGGDDTLIGSGVSDTILGGEGNDTLDAGAGDDWLDSGGGNDTLMAGDGNDTLHAGLGSDWIDGGAGADTVTASAGNDTLRGGLGDDFLSGGSGNDTLHAGWGADTLIGGGGNDTLQSLVTDIYDRDKLIGQAGSDLYQVSLLTDQVMIGDEALVSPADTVPMSGARDFDVVEIRASDDPDSLIVAAQKNQVDIRDGVTRNTKATVTDVEAVVLHAGDETGRRGDTLNVSNASDIELTIVGGEPNVRRADRIFVKGDVEFEGFERKRRLK